MNVERIILDTNFLFLHLAYKIDIFAELESHYGSYEPIVLSTTIDELKILKQRESRTIRKRVESAMDIIRKCSTIEVERLNDETFDDVIIRIAEKWQCTVATNDKILKKRLRSVGIPVLYMRQKKKLETEGYIR
jgi:rRNA-processing protein FCF1